MAEFMTAQQTGQRMSPYAVDICGQLSKRSKRVRIETLNLKLGEREGTENGDDEYSYMGQWDG
jgi:hypothetical protein